MPIAPDIFSSELEIPEQKLKDDGRSSDSEGATPLEPVERDLGFILDEPDEEKVAKFVHEMREDQEPQRSRDRAVAKRNAWWREGKRWVRLEKKENQNIWEAKIPTGMGNAPPVPNKTDRLCRRLVNVIWVDPAFPECEPGDDTPEAREAAEFATRYLSVKGAPSDLNMEMICRAALDKSMTYMSSFGWVTMDPAGNGHRPRRVMAHPAATHQENAQFDPAAPEAPAPEDQLTERYVRPDKALTDDPNEADYQWMPSPSVRLLNSNNVYLLPQTATHLRKAFGIIIIDNTTLGELRSLFGEKLDELSTEDFDDLCKWKPDKYKDFLPAYSPDIKDQIDKEKEGNERWLDSQTVWTLTVYYRSCPEYPMGCYAVVGGKATLLHREKWTAMMPQEPGEDGKDKPAKETCLEVPLAQQRCLDDNTFDNPMGVGVAEHLGPADEIVATALGYELEHMFRAGNPHPLLPMGTIVQPKQWQRRTGDPVLFNPQGKPEMEKIEPLSPTIPLLREEMQTEMNDESGLQQGGQGMETPDIKSGIHARLITQEALKAVSNIKANSSFFYIDLNRIILEQTRAFATVPDLLSWQGKDGEYKAKEFSRTSFKNTKIVTIARGSFTMHTLMAKQEMANEMRANKAIDDEDYIEMMAGGVSPILGMQENPDLMRIRRQIDLYKKGPPDGWIEQMMQWQRITAEITSGNQAGISAQAATGIPYQAQQPPPKPPGPFDDVLPIDDEPSAAKIRHRQIKRTMATTQHASFHPLWKAELERTYVQAKNSAGVMTVPEIQKMEAQKAQDAKAAALAAQTSVSVKADASNVAQTEEEIARGAQAGAQGLTPDVPAGNAAGPAPNGQNGASAGGATHIHIHPSSGGKDITYVRDAKGAVVGHQIRDAQGADIPAVP